MKLSFTTVCLMAPLALFANAQSISDLPSCATGPAISSIGSTGCSLTDFACICKNQTFINALLPQVQKACSAADLAKSLALAQSLCLSNGVTVSLPGITSMPTATGTTTSGSVMASAMTTASGMSMSTSGTSVATSMGTASSSASAAAQTTNAASSGFASSNSIVGAFGAIIGMMFML